MRPVYFLTFSFLLTMSLFSFFQTSNAQTAPTLAPDEFLQRVDEGAVVIDVRTPSEFAQGHLTDARNLNISAPGFREAAGRLDPDTTYYLYCRTGSRSGQATRIFREMGYDAYNVGGLTQLARAGADVTR